MAAGGIVSDIQFAALDVGRESRERAVPDSDTWARPSDRAFNAFGFLAAGSFVDQNRPGEEVQQFFFEWIRDAFGRILADAEAHRGCVFGGIESGVDVGAGVIHAENL
jgi:hypothetical protein